MMSKQALAPGQGQGRGLIVTTAILQYREDSIITTTPYSPAFVRDIKRQIPSDFREYDPSHKQWIVSVAFEDELTKLCKRHYSDVRVIKESASSTAIPEHYRTLYVLPDAPDEVVQAAYRALVRMHHPDVSNDPDSTATMQRINEAYELVNEVAS